MNETKYNKAQLEAINTTDGTVQVISSAGSGKCIVGSSYVYTENGICTMKDIYNNLAINQDKLEIKVRSLDLDKQKMYNATTSNFFNMGESDTIRITTTYGYELEGTPEHPIIVLGENNKPVFKQLQYITKEDTVLISANNNLWGKETKVTEELAYFIGLIVGNDYYNDYKFAIDINKYKKIPQDILNSPANIVEKCLQGILNENGHFYSYNDKDVITYCTTCEELAKQIHILLLNFGVVSKLEVIQGYYCLYIEEPEEKYNKHDKYTKHTKYDKHDKYVKDSDDNFFSDTIKEINKSKATVYDFTVPDSHSFVANGFINHNTTVLISRIANLIDKGVPSEEILAISFTNASATDLNKKLEEREIVGVTSGTFHAVCRSLLENIDKEYDNLTNFPDKYKYKRELENITKEKNLNIDEIMSWIDYQKAYGLTSKDKFKHIKSLYEERELREYFRLYENYCMKNKAYDFNDWLILALKEYENGRITKKWDYVSVDEAMDMNMVQYKLTKHFCKGNNLFVVGDGQQCWEEHGLVRTDKGTKQVKDIKVGDYVECNNGGIVCYKPVTNISNKIVNQVVTFTTETGAHITTTLDHKFFVHNPTVKDGSIFLYLLYHSDKGFTIGLLHNKETEEIMNKALEERTDRLWFIKRFTDLSQAYYYEEYYSLKYYIPKVYCHSDSKTYENQNGLQMLNDLDMSFYNPNYTTQTSVRLKHNTQIGGIGEESNCKNYSVEIMRDGEVSNKEYYHSFKDAYTYAQQSEREISNSFIYETLDIGYISKSPYNVVNAANTTVDMETVISDGKVFSSDNIVKREVKVGKFTVYNVEVAESGTMVVNNVLTHNCIYGFRGSVPEQFRDFHKMHKKVKVINMNTNYRSCNNLVKSSNNFIRPYAADDVNYKDAVAYNRKDGIIKCGCSPSRDAEAEKVVKQIKELFKQGVKPKDIGIIYRNNAHADYVEAELKKQKIDYKVFSSNSFFDRAEIKGILAVLRLIEDVTDDEAFENLFNARLYPLMYYKNTVLSDLKSISGQKDCSLYEALLDYKFRLDWQNRNKGFFVDMINRLKIQKDKRLCANKLIENIVKTFKVIERLKEKYPYETILDKKESIKNFANMGKNYQLTPFLSFCDNGGIVKTENKDCIELRTIHSVKGLEYPVVFLIGLEEDKFPSNKASIESEARLMYVAITRAKEQFYLSSINESEFYNEYKEGVIALNTDKPDTGKMNTDKGE